MTKFKDNINIIDFVDACIKDLNVKSKKEGLEKVYRVEIKKGTTPTDVSKTSINKKKGGQVQSKLPTRSLRFIMDNLSTHERVVLYQDDKVFTNASEIITSNYRRVLYKRLLLNMLLSFAVNMEEHIQLNNIKKLEDNLVK